MKKLLCLLALSLPAFAAAPIVVIDDNFNATVDGSGFGKAGDVIVNNKNNAELVVAVNIALTAKLAALKSAADASVAAANSARDAAITAKEAEKTAAVNAANAAKTNAENAKTAAEAAKSAAEAAKATESARVAAIVAALKSVAMPGPLPAVVAQAILTEDQKKKAALEAQQAEIAATLAALTDKP